MFHIYIPVYRYECCLRRLFSYYCLFEIENESFLLLISNFSVAIISVALTPMYYQEAVSTISCSDTYFLFCEWTYLSLVYIHCGSNHRLPAYNYVLSRFFMHMDTEMSGVQPS